MMKKVTTLLTLTLLLTTFKSTAQWTVNNMPVPGYFTGFDIHFLDENVGFVGGTTNLIGGNGKISKTTNGGSTWTDVLEVTSKTVEDIYFIDNNLGFAVGGGGLIAKTTDGGNNWSTQIYTNPNTFNFESFESVYFVDQNTGYIAGGLNEMWVLKTSDGGANWTPLTMPAYFQRLQTVHFTDVNTGYVAGGSGTGGGNGRVYKTSDGGATWDLLNTGIAPNYYNTIYFTDANNGILGCDIDGLLLKTTDAGLNWSAVTNPAGISSVEEFSFVNSSLGYAAILSGKIIKTTDGGANWTLDGDVAPTMSALYAITTPTATYGATVGLFGQYAEMTGTSGIIDVTKNHITVYPNPTKGAVLVDLGEFNGELNATLTNTLGQVVLTKKMSATNSIQLNFEEEPKGIYFLKVESSKGDYFTQKIIKE